MMNGFMSKIIKKDREALYDRQILFLAITLICIGFIMIFSSSITQATNKFNDPFFYGKRDLIAVSVALLAGFVVLFIPGDFYKNHNFLLLIVGICSLVLVLLVGTKINHARRWIRFVGFNIQPSEIMKFCWIIYLSSFLTRKHEEVTKKLRAFVKQLALFILIFMLLLCQPDYGSAAVMFGILLGLLFVGGAHLLSYITGAVIMICVMVFFAFFATYRLNRMVTFLDPWATPFGQGYQLTQSLMAFGRGGLLGEGLGNSVQKMEYLPEAHTDFVFAILGEEFGFVGVSVVILLEMWLAFRLFSLSRRFLKANELFSGYVSFGVGLMISIQTVINIGAASGMLPTKGLTLPLISYGGSSLMMMVMSLAVVLKLDYEYRLKRQRKTSA